MGRGSSKTGGGAVTSNMKWQPETNVMTQGGVMLNLSKTPLMYGPNDPSLSAAQRKAVEAQEQKRSAAKTEYALLVDANGNEVTPEVGGGRSRVRLQNSDLAVAEILTHNHPRGKGEVGELGGTFSGTDMNTFANHPNIKTIRASAAEGTYSITKGPNFNAPGFKAFCKRMEKQRQDELDKASDAFVKKSLPNVQKGLMSYTDFNRGQKKLFNEFLIKLHNDYISGQNQYGYSYTLERRQ